MLPFRIGAIVFALCVSVLSTQATEVWPTPKHNVTKVVVHKSKRTMELWAGDKVLRTYKVSLGGNPVGHKERKGDGKTPEGSYTLDFRKANSIAHKSIHVSYPSAKDIAEARAKGFEPGGSIMIHGIWNGYGWAGGIMKYFDWTNGCIGLNNNEMDELWELLAWNTPIDILP